MAALRLILVTGMSLLYSVQLVLLHGYSTQNDILDIFKVQVSELFQKALNDKGFIY